MACQSFNRHDHDHDICFRDALGASGARCAAERIRLTPIRRRVLELLLDAPRAQGAYDILARLNAEGLGSQPPMIYRALDFLVRHGFAHRIEKTNALLACAHPGRAHLPAFLICRKCDRVAEKVGSAPRRPDEAAPQAGFVIERTVVEALGLCPDCAGSEP